MKVLIIYAHPNPMSFTHSILDNFVRGLNEAGHQYEQMDMRKMIIGLAGGPVRRLAAKLYIKNKNDDDLRELISSQKPRDVLVQQKKVAEADVLVFITQVIWMHFPAIMKGWLERVFSYGFAYRLNESG